MPNGAFLVDSSINKFWKDPKDPLFVARTLSSSTNQFRQAQLLGRRTISRRSAADSSGGGTCSASLANRRGDTNIQSAPATLPSGQTPGDFYDRHCRLPFVRARFSERNRRLPIPHRSGIGMKRRKSRRLICKMHRASDLLVSPTFARTRVAACITGVNNFGPANQDTRTISSNFAIARRDDTVLMSFH